MKITFLFLTCLSIVSSAFGDQFQLETPVAFQGASSDSGTGKTNGVSEASGSLYKTIIDQESGAYAIVSTNREIITLMNKTGHVVWTTNVVEGIKSMPLLGERKIKGLSIYQGDLWANIGRGYCLINITNGGVKGIASD